jgi:hypothetical protein
MSFRFKLERLDGTPAEPPSITSVVPNWPPLAFSRPSVVQL